MTGLSRGAPLVCAPLKPRLRLFPTVHHSQVEIESAVSFLPVMSAGAAHCRGMSATLLEMEATCLQMEMTATDSVWQGL